MVKQEKNNLTDNATAKPVHDENYWFMILLYFASFLVGLGVIAMIAANWQQIPNNLKLFGALAAMALNACVLSWTVKHDKNILKQVVACVFAFLIMAVIGLIGQIYHLSANIENALLLWSLCSCPLLLVAPRLLWLWLPFFYGGVRFFSIGFFDDFSIFSANFIFRKPDFEAENYGILINLLRTLSCLGLFTAYEIWVTRGNAQNKTVSRPLFVYSGLMMYFLYVNIVRVARVIAFSVNTDPAQTQHLALSLVGAYILPCLLAGVGLYLLNRKIKRTSFMPIFLTATLLEFVWVYMMVRSYIGNAPHYYGMFSNFSYEFISPIVFIWITMRYTGFHKVSQTYRYLSYIAVALWFFVVFGENLHYVIPSLALCAIGAWFAYRANSRRWFNVAVIAAVIRVLVYYADVSDLMHAGIYLTCSGILIIAVILLLMKYGPLLWEKKNEK